jgi:MFS family permease
MSPRQHIKRQRQYTGKSLHKHMSKGMVLYAWFVCVVGALFYCYEYFLRITPSVMENDLTHVYHLNAASFGDVSAYYYYAYTPLQFFVGILMDRYGPRRLLTAACFLCALGAYLFGASHFVWLAEIGRFLIGFGSAFAFVGALKLATIWLPPERFGMISGGATALGMLGAMIGQVALARLVEAFHWQMTLYFSAALGILLTLAIWFVVRDGQKVHGKKNYADTTDYNVLFKNLWASIKNPQIWIIGLIGLCLYLSLSMFAELWAIPYLSQAHHITIEQAAPISSMIFLGWAIGGPLAGLLSDYIKRRRLPIIVGSFCAAILSMVIIYSPHMPLPLLYVLLVVFGIFNSVQVLVFALSREVSSQKISGAAIALTNMFVMMGGMIFQPVIGHILNATWTGKYTANHLQLFTNHNFQIALSVLPIALIIAFFASMFLKETHCIPKK